MYHVHLYAQSWNGIGSSALTRSQIEQNIISSMRLHEIWDLIDAMKKLVTEDNTRGQFHFSLVVVTIIGNNYLLTIRTKGPLYPGDSSAADTGHVRVAEETRLVSASLGAAATATGC